MLNPNFVILGVLFELIGGSSYLIDTAKGKIKPNKVTWFLWAFAPLIAFVAELKQGVGILSLMTFIVGFMPLLIFIASFFNKKSYWKIGSLDIICGVLSLLGVIIWSFTKVGNIAILFSILADLLAAVPTIVKSYTNPETENDLLYLFAMFNSGIAILTIHSWNFENYGFPIYIFLIDLLLFVLIRFKLGKALSSNRK
jgi:hypothetical protein